MINKDMRREYLKLIRELVSYLKTNGVKIQCYTEINSDQVIIKVDTYKEYTTYTFPDLYSALSFLEDLKRGKIYG